MSVIREQTVPIVCGWGVGWGDREPYPSFCQVGILEIRFCVILQKMSECQHCHMSILSESRRGPCISYLDFLINTDRSLFPQEDIRNDLDVI